MHQPIYDAQALSLENERERYPLKAQLTLARSGGVGGRSFVACGENRGRGFQRDNTISTKEGRAIIALTSSIASPHYHEEVSSWYL